MELDIAPGLLYFASIVYFYDIHSLWCLCQAPGMTMTWNQASMWTSAMTAHGSTTTNSLSACYESPLKTNGALWTGSCTNLAMFWSYVFGCFWCLLAIGSKACGASNHICPMYHLGFRLSAILKRVGAQSDYSLLSDTNYLQTTTSNVCRFTTQNTTPLQKYEETTLQ